MAAPTAHPGCLSSIMSIPSLLVKGVALQLTHLVQVLLGMIYLDLTCAVKQPTAARPWLRQWRACSARCAVITQWSAAHAGIAMYLPVKGLLEQQCQSSCRMA